MTSGSAANSPKRSQRRAGNRERWTPVSLSSKGPPSPNKEANVEVIDCTASDDGVSFFARGIMSPFQCKAPAELGDDQGSQGSQRWADVHEDVEDLASVETVTPSSGQSTSSHGSNEATSSYRLPPRPPAPVRPQCQRVPWEVDGVSGSDYRSKLRAGGQEALQRTMAGFAKGPASMLPPGACAHAEHGPMFAGPASSPHGHPGAHDGFYAGYSPAAYNCAEQYYDHYSPVAAMTPSGMHAAYGEQWSAPYGSPYHNSTASAPQHATSYWGASPTAAVAVPPSPHAYSAQGDRHSGPTSSFGLISQEVAAMTTARPEVSGLSQEELAAVLRASAEDVYED